MGLWLPCRIPGFPITFDANAHVPARKARRAEADAPALRTADRLPVGAAYCLEMVMVSAGSVGVRWSKAFTFTYVGASFSLV